MNDDPQALGNAETYLINVLEGANPRRDASGYNITAAAQDFHDTAGSWDLAAADPQSLEDLLGRHAK